MMKIFTISFSFLILLQSFGISLNDLSQFDELIEHARYHNEQYGDDMLVFISKHYGELKSFHDIENHEEKEDHDQLPFQHQSQVPVANALVTIFTKEDFKTFELTESNNHNFHYQAPTSSVHSLGLFQPPRHA